MNTLSWKSLYGPVLNVFSLFFISLTHSIKVYNLRIPEIRKEAPIIIYFATWNNTNQNNKLFTSIGDTFDEISIFDRISGVG